MAVHHSMSAAFAIFCTVMHLLFHMSLGQMAKSKIIYVELCCVYVYIIVTKIHCSSATVIWACPWSVYNIMADVGVSCGCAVMQAGPCMVQCWTHQQVWGCGQDSSLNTRQLVHHLDHLSSAQCAAIEL